MELCLLCSCAIWRKKSEGPATEEMPDDLLDEGACLWRSSVKEFHSRHIHFLLLLLPLPLPTTMCDDTSFLKRRRPKYLLCYLQEVLFLCEVLAWMIRATRKIPRCIKNGQFFKVCSVRFAVLQNEFVQMLFCFAKVSQTRTKRHPWMEVVF